MKWPSKRRCTAEFCGIRLLWWWLHVRFWRTSIITHLLSFQRCVSFTPHCRHQMFKFHRNRRCFSHSSHILCVDRVYYYMCAGLSLFLVFVFAWNVKRFKRKSKMKSTWKNAPFYICVKLSVIAYISKNAFLAFTASAGTCERARPKIAHSRALERVHTYIYTLWIRDRNTEKNSSTTTTTVHITETHHNVYQRALCVHPVTFQRIIGV